MRIDTDALLSRVGSMTHEELISTLALLDELEVRRRVALAQIDFLAFIAAVDPHYKFGVHLKRLGGLLMQIERGEKDRIAVSIAPRFGKSQMISIYYPAWYIGKHPEHKLILASHTADLAVDMARKVRNLMQTEEYKRIFPGVTIAADAKAAGKWNTTKGGEVFACIEPHTPVLTPLGYRQATQLTVGDYILVGCARKRVQAVFESVHSETVRIDGVGFSANHPIWTANRGWVPARAVTFLDTLWVENFWDRLKALIRGGLNGYLEHPDVSPLVQHQVALHQPQQREVGALRRARNRVVQAMDDVCQFLRRHGGSAFARAYGGPDRQRWAVQSGELPLGDYAGAGEQPVEQLGRRWRDDSAARAVFGCVSRNHHSPYSSGDAGERRRKDVAPFTSELQAYDPPENHGWRSGALARWIGRSGGRCEPGQPDGWLEIGLARCRRATQVVQGLLLGVRRPLTIVVESHPPKRFINYRIESGDVFYAGGILTHNCGVGGALAGRGAHLAVVDDVLSEQDLKAGDTDSLDTVYEWFRTGLRTRLMPGGRIAILHCLTGDTRVTMADGTETALRDIRPNDLVMSYDNGALRPARVLGWANQGVDRVYALGLRSGVIIRGNERHPLLVEQDGERKWITIKDLRPGMRLVRVTNQGVGSWYTRGRSAVITITRLVEKTRAALRLPNGVSGRIKRAVRTVAASLRILTGSVSPALIRPSTRNVKPLVRTIALPHAATRTSKCAMGSLALTTTGCSLRSVAYVLSAASLQPSRTPPRNGACAALPLITATTLGAFEPSCATNAISSSKNGTRSSGFNERLSTLSVTLDEIVSITPDGEEDVFDIEVEGTENFLANGVVSHNTRWHARDLIGRVTKDAAMNPDADQYEVFEFPAILTTPNPNYDPNDPESPAEIQKSLWPEQWPLEALLRTKASMAAWQWNAQYMQSPTAQEAALIKREHIRWWENDTPPECDFIVQSWDTAMTTKDRSDYSVCQTWGVWTTEDGVDNVILLNSVRRKVEFPELKRIALEQVQEWEPDALIVEAKASGQPLIDELRRSGIFVQEFSPGKGQDKIARVNAVADMFVSGQVWFPETRWATEVVDEVCAFPSGEHDDAVDAMTLALRRIRQGGLLRLTSDHEDPDPLPYRRRAAYY